MRVSISFFFLHCFLLCLMCRVVRLEVWLEICWNCFATLLEPNWGQLLNSWECFFWGRQLKTRIPLWNCDAGILAWTFEETFAGTLAWTLLSRVPRLQGQGAKFQACTRILRMQVSKVLGFIQDYIKGSKFLSFQGSKIPRPITPGFSGFHGSRI